MAYEKENLIDCTQFEEHLSDYLDKALDSVTHKAVAAHALSCPLCHALLNEVKGALSACKAIAEPSMTVTRLEARILERTMPQAVMHCEEFEEHLTDYLDGFLPAQLFHRWERHAVVCDNCTDLPGAVVRSLAAVVTYKMDELPVPSGLHQRILEQTLGTAKAKTAKASLGSKFGEWVRGFSFPISVPQFAPVAMMMMLAFLTFSQTVSADGSLSDVYAKGYELAEQTYKQGADVLGTKPAAQQPQQSQEEPVEGTVVNEQK